MDISALVNKKDDAAKYMEEEITHIIKTFEKRDPGSVGEKQAIDYMAEQLKDTCDEVIVEPFDLHPGAFFGWIFITVTLVLLGIVVYFFAPIIAFIMIAIGLSCMVGEFLLYKKMVDKLFPKKTSHNITAIKKPTGEVKRRIFYNGHPDATWEWTYNNKFGGVGFSIQVMTGIGSGIMAFIFSLVGIILRVAKGVNLFGMIPYGQNASLNIISILGFIMVASAPFLFLTYFLSNSKIVVDGANDNLTGCYMGIALLKFMKDLGIEMEHTEVGVIITGSEEAGLRGGKAWAEAHKGEYQDVETLIFSFDTIHDPKHLGICKRDLNNIVKSDEKATAMFKTAADQLGIHCGVITVPFGATDNAAFAQGGFRSSGVTGLAHKLEDYYHTRRDTYDNLNLEGLSSCFAVCAQMLGNYENEG